MKVATRKKRAAKPKAPLPAPSTKEDDTEVIPGTLYKSPGPLPNIAVALATFQAQIRVVKHDKRAGKYTYATLPAILEEIAEPLAEVGLSIAQFPISDGPGRVGVTSILLHISGEYIYSSFCLDVPKPVRSHQGKEVMTKTQCEGVALSYARRYSITAVLGLATELDTDANVD